MHNQSRFRAALEYTHQIEKGYVNDPDDEGGATNYGISLRALLKLEGGNLEEFDLDDDGDIDADDIKLLNDDLAMRFYREHYWYPALDEMTSDILAIKTYDLGVNAGLRTAQRNLQRAVKVYYPGLKVDGAFGPRSMMALQGVLESLDNDDTKIVDLFCQYQSKYYYDIVEAKLSRLKFLLGWLRRAYKVPTL